jgi:hypothetical protein
MTTNPAARRLIEFISHPFLRTVPMSSAELAAIEKRSRKTMGSKEGARISFMADTKGRRAQNNGKWQEVGL